MRIRIAFHLVNAEISEEEFSDLLKHSFSVLGLRDEQVWRKGEQIQGKVLHQNTGVRLVEVDSCSKDLESSLANVLSFARPHFREIHSWRREAGFQAELACTVYIPVGHLPMLNFSPKTLASIASFGATLDVDLIETEVAELTS